MLADKLESDLIIDIFDIFRIRSLVMNAINSKKPKKTGSL